MSKFSDKQQARKRQAEAEQARGHSRRDTQTGQKVHRNKYASESHASQEQARVLWEQTPEGQGELDRREKKKKLAEERERIQERYGAGVGSSNSEGRFILPRNYYFSPEARGLENSEKYLF